MRGCVSKYPTAIGKLTGCEEVTKGQRLTMRKRSDPGRGGCQNSPARQGILRPRGEGGGTWSLSDIEKSRPKLRRAKEAPRIPRR